MKHFISKSFVIESNDGTSMEFYLNADGNIFANRKNDDTEGLFWFEIPKDSWDDFKLFFDEQFKYLDNG